MMKKLFPKKIAIFWMFFSFLSIVFTFYTNVNAANNTYKPSAALYKNNEDVGFSSSTGKTDTFSSGTQVGYLSLSGSIQHQGVYYGTTAYSATECINIGYHYYEVFQSGNPDNWNIVDSDEKTLDGKKLSKDIEKGTIIIQKSYDGRKWDDACDPIRNCFDLENNEVNLSYIYTIDSNDLRDGCYYRVLVLYEMKKKTGTESTFFGGEDPIFDTKCFVEKYDFYVCYGANPIQMYNIMNRAVPVSDKGTVENGFIIDTNDTNVSVSVIRDNFSAVSAVDYQSFYLPGKYTILSTNPIGDRV